MTISDTLIRFTVRNDQTGELKPCYVEKCSFADGPGLKVKKVTRTFDRAKAGRFRKDTAYIIARQFFQHEMLALEKVSGGVWEEDTERLKAEQKVLFEKSQVEWHQYQQAMAALEDEIFGIVSRAMR